MKRKILIPFEIETDESGKFCIEKIENKCNGLIKAKAELYYFCDLFRKENRKKTELDFYLNWKNDKKVYRCQACLDAEQK